MSHNHDSTNYYFKRFNQKDLDLAIANESITIEHVARILKFYNNDIFIVKGLASVQLLQSVIPDVFQIEHQVEEDLYHMHVETWPHIKPMCLKFARKNPCQWIYVTQDDDRVLFRYDLDTFLLYN